MSVREHESRDYSALGFVVTFFTTLFIARLVTDLAMHGVLIRHESWVSPESWVVPVGFALIGCYAYWYRNKS